MSLIEEARAVRQRIAARLSELEPLVREYEELRRAAAELGIDPAEELAGEPAPSPRAARGATSGRARSSRRRSPVRPSAGERAATATGDEGDGLGDRVLQAVREQPGQTVADYARVLELAPTVLYRPVRELTTSGQIVKRNRQLYPS
jgi:hypothetical protein